MPKQPSIHAQSFKGAIFLYQMFAQHGVLTSKVYSDGVDLKLYLVRPKIVFNTLSPNEKEIKKLSIHHLATQSTLFNMVSHNSNDASLKHSSLPLREVS